LFDHRNTTPLTRKLHSQHHRSRQQTGWSIGRRTRCCFSPERLCDGHWRQLPTTKRLRRRRQNVLCRI